jgi:hypothetical protein
LNFGNFFNAIFIFVAAPLYYIFFNLLYIDFGNIFYEFFIKLKNVTLFVQLLNIVLLYIICPFCSLTPTAYCPLNNIYYTFVFV